LANFYEAYQITKKHEGGYVNDKDDVGGETYKGISRRYHPSWPGWRIVDAYKGKSDFLNKIYSDEKLEELVIGFYKEHFWDVNLLDEVSSQSVANEMFDTGVNMGVGRAAKFLQKALNVLNKNGRLYPDLVEDGVIGSGTLRALNACLSYRGDVYIYKVLNILQGMHYVNFMSKSSVQEKFAYGWLDRVDFIKK
jgi:lysozyme family protein